MVDEVKTGRFCSASNSSGHCSPEYTLVHTVDGERHSTPIRKHLHAGDRVHAFEGSDGQWYITEDPGFGNSRVAWMLFGAGAVVVFVGALLCLRSWAMIPKPT